jgi:hypothetical protein
VGDDTWIRGRGVVVSQAVIALAYYLESNPGMVMMARHGLAQVIEDVAN